MRFQTVWLGFDHLKRTEVVGITERELIRRVEQRIHADLYRIDGAEMDAHVARLLIGEIVFDWFQQPLKKPALVEYLVKHGYHERELSRDKTILDLIATRNSGYARLVEAELIQAVQIERAEAKEAHAALSGNLSKKRVTIIGTAGLGKSCAVAQTLHLLERDGILDAFQEVIHGLDCVVSFGDSVQPDFIEFFETRFSISNHRLNVE